MSVTLSRFARRLGHRLGALNRFCTTRDGNVAVTFGLLSLPMMALTGVAVDYGLETRQQVKLQAATDATALLLCQTPLNTTTAQLQTQAGSTMTGFFPTGTLTVDPITVTSSPRQITLKTHVRSATYFSPFTSVATPQVTASAQCATPLPKTFEIALVLDTTGSMGESSNGQTKLQALQQAATNFVNYVHNNAAFSANTRISIVPFAAAVAVNPSTYRNASWIDQNGQSAYHWLNVTSPSSANFQSRFDIFAKLQAVNSNWGWGGCLEKLPYPTNVQDVSPTSDPNTLYVPLFAPDEVGGGSTGLTSYTQTNRSTYYALNSYIDDSTSSNSCAASTTLTALQQEARACKYLSPTHPNYTTAAYGSTSTVSLGQTGPNFGCNSQPLQRLTTSTSSLTTLINSLTSGGTTDIHEGFMWGWRTLSPNSVFADGTAYSSTTINKIIILMTDGTDEWLINGATANGSIYNDIGYLINANGSTPNPRLASGNQNVASQSDARAALDELTSEACTNAKGVGISVYTIGFSIQSDPIDSTGQALLSRCASSASQYFLANDSNGLLAAFDKIGKSIGSLRLSK